MRKLFSLFAAVLVALVANAAVINITNETPDALRTALNSAADGDEIVMAAGTYVESNGNYIAFDGKAVTVKAAEGAEVIIQPQVPITVSNGGHAIFENVKIDASRLTELADWYEHLFYVTDGNPNGYTFRGCELYGFNLNSSMFYCNNVNKVAAMKFENCYFHDLMKSIVFVENTDGKPLLNVKNCTFANISTNTESYYAGIIDVRAAEATLTVDHCTFYNVIPMNTDYSCVSKITLAKGNVSNCIFMLPTAQDGIRAMRGVTATNCITFNYLKDNGTGIHSSVTQTNCIQQDPLFVNAAEGNFTLGEGSPALTMNNGEPIGDPRWVPAVAPVEPLMKTIYCKMDKDWWKADGAAVGCYTWNDGGDPKAAWPGERMTPVEGETDIWSIELDINTYHMCIFTRVNGEGDVADWGAKTGDLTIPTDENDMFTITNADPTWGDPGCIGAWSKYEPSAPAEMTAIYDWAGEIGTTVLGTNSVETTTVKIHTNTDAVPAIKFGSSFVYADGKWIAIKPAEGGFKAGDVLSVALVFNNADDTKYAQIDLRAANGDTRIWLSDSASTINGRTSAGDPIVQTYTLEADQDSLFIGRYGNTGMFVTLLKVERAAGETPVVLEAPDAAPAAPTYAGYQVHAAYSATYNADCNFGEWGSGTQYTQEEFGKKYVTNNMGYFGLEFTGMDCSEMGALHLDVWVAADASIRIVPIHGGTEVGVTAQLEGQKWNSIDIALSEFEGVTNWSNVYQIKIDNASNLTFWLNNVYFYTTQEKTVDLVDGYYLIGSINGWDIHNLTADHLFAVNPENEAEYKLHYTLAEGNEFKVVAVANNELGAWYPGEAGNYVVDFAHVGEKDIYFRPDYQGGEGWHAGCIYVEGDANANPWETWFATGDTWNTETESYMEWDGENQKATIHINVDKYGQWRAQAKYHGPVAEAGKCYRVALKLKANNAINNVTIKYQDNDQDGAEMVYVQDAALEANVEYVFDRVAAGTDGGNGIMVLDFGFAHAGDIIEIYDVVIEEAECPQVEHTYTVAGGSADLFGTTWDPTNAANDMAKLEDGTYKFEKTEITLPAGNVEFKVCEDHAWTHCYPADNYQLVIPEAGVYTITITYNPEGNVVAGDAVKTGDAQVDPVVSIAGSMNSWNASADVMVLAADKATASLTLNLAAQTYEFKVVINGGDWRSNAHEFTRENAVAAEMTGNLDNMHIVADVAGEYVFTWTFATNTLVITFPQGEGIDNTAVETKAIKRIVNGQLFIEMNGVLYNAQGILVR